MLGKDTLEGVLFKHHIRVHSYKHNTGSLEFENIAIGVIISLHLGLVFLSIITMREMNAWIFLHMFAVCFFFVLSTTRMLARG